MTKTLIPKRVLVYKLRAALVSLSVFFIFAILLTALTWHFWFPDYLFWLDGGEQGIKLVYAVDIVLGPLLTLIFFHPDKPKKKLLFDVALVVTIQLSAMIWGCYQVYSQRPIAVVYGEGRFISVAPDIMALQRKTAADLKVYSEHNPPFIYRRETVGEKEKQRFVVMLMKGGFHGESQAWLFTPFKEHLADVFQRQKGFQHYMSQSLLPQWQQKFADQPLAKYRFALYEGRYGNAVLVFSPAGEYVDYLTLDDAVLPEILADNDTHLTEKAH